MVERLNVILKAEKIRTLPVLPAARPKTVIICF